MISVLESHNDRMNYTPGECQDNEIVDNRYKNNEDKNIKRFRQLALDVTLDTETIFIIIRMNYSYLTNKFCKMQGDDLCRHF